MSLRALPLTLLCLLLAACGESAPQPDATSKSDPPMESAVGPEAQTPGFYIGRWAEKTQDCGGRAWTFSADRLIAPPGICVFENISLVDEGVEIDADCSWEGETTTTHMRLSYAQSARALLVMDGPAGDLGLVACPAG